jgi:hypothetical protein
VQPKQEWSEDDKFNLSDIEAMINTMKGDEKNAEKLINWLKSLKDRYTWKPSEEQMENLSHAVNGGTYRTSLLMELYQDLKKLREE